MPYGPLQAAQLYASGTGSIAQGALSMFMFCVENLPLLFGFGAISSVISERFTSIMMKVSVLLVAIMGAGMLSIGILARFYILPN